MSTQIIEEKGDLFDLDSTWSLAHCVGNDFIMGKGIAVAFRERFGQQDWLIANSKGVGTTLCLQVQDRCIFYLVTKPYSKRSKPTYENIGLALADMVTQARALGVTKIAMPLIGCGLDGKDWSKI